MNGNRSPARINALAVRRVKRRKRRAPSGRRVVCDSPYAVPFRRPADGKSARQPIENLRSGPFSGVCHFHTGQVTFAAMPIPPLDPNGFLPAGVHDGTLDEIRARFGIFQRSDRRLRLFEKLEAFLAEASGTAVVVSVVVDGSFVTAKLEPNDIDLIVMVSAAHDFGADLPPHQYNVLAQQRVRRRFGFDIVVAKMGSDNLAEAVAFFSQVRQQPGLKKGLVRVIL